MKKIPIIWRVTLWYTMFLLLVTTLIFIVLFASGQRLSESYSKNYLIDAVNKSIGEIEYDDGILEFDDDLYDYKNVHILVFDAQQQLLFGHLVAGVFEEDLVNEELKEIESAQHTYYVYDQVANIPQYGEIWIRGVSNQDNAVFFSHTILGVAMMIIPFLIIIAITGGYLMTRKALSPIRYMIDAVTEINDGHDLSRRITINGAYDEMYELGQTFDNMFERLEKAFKKEQQFTANASHELRTPVAVIVAQSEYALSPGISKQERQEALQTIHRQSEKISHLISALLSMARMDDHRQLQLEEVDINEMVEMIVEEMSIRAEMKKIKIVCNIDQNLVKCCDQTLVTRLLINLIANSIQYGQQEGTTQITIAQQEGKVIGSVSDDGIGISAADQLLIWDRFYRADQSRGDTGEEHYGLGLAMVKWIVAVHGGEVEVASTLGKGTTFSFWF